MPFTKGQLTAAVRTIQSDGNLSKFLFKKLTGKKKTNTETSFPGDYDDQLACQILDCMGFSLQEAGLFQK